MPTIASHYARAALAGAERQGKDTERLLARAGIARQVLGTHGARVHADQLSRLIRLIWKELGDEFMGFTRHRSKQGTFAMMCQLVSHCENLEGLFKQGIQFYSLVTDDIAMSFDCCDREAVFSVTMTEPDLDPEHFYLEFWLIIWHRFASWITGRQIKLKSAHFTYAAPADADEFRHLFPTRCHFNQPLTQLVFDAHYLQQPLVKTSRELAQFLKHSPADLMTIPGEDDSFSRRIKAIILHPYDETLRFPAFNEIADRFHISPQTLRRKLQAEGSSYRKIKDGIRRDMAIEKLSVQDMPVNDVAGLLGFAEPRSFTRAFKQWTGVSPSHYRGGKRCLTENLPFGDTAKSGA